MPREDSYIVLDAARKPTTYVGDDAVQYARVRILRAAIKLYRNSGIIPTRGMTITRMLNSVTALTRKSYKRGQCDRAIEDLDIWLNNMASALPIQEA
jgi:hypothetical protein